ncbi:MAG TPA: NAD(P)-dependent oxidoreductase [Candidatus Saccharimonadales bacterium]|nr:NAD(P)-dependent oxidoreductase [Candidatus Saccharimonadales bacterium]
MYSLKILITGASGKVGAAVAAALEKTHRLVLVDREPPKTVRPGIISYELDLAAPHNLGKVMQIEKPDAVIHLAALLGPACEQDPSLAEKINTDATALLAELAAANGVKRFVFASTSGVYAQEHLSATNESSNIRPLSIYGKTKLRAEQALNLVADRSETTFVALRMFNVYGPAFTDSLVYKLTYSTAEHPVTVYGPDVYYRDYVHVSDVARAIEAATLRPLPQALHIFNVGSGKATNTTSLITQLKGLGITPYYVLKRGSELQVTWADISRAEQMLGFHPVINIVV